MVRSLYRKGRASHSDALRDARKVLFYARAEVERLEALHKPEAALAMAAEGADVAFPTERHLYFAQSRATGEDDSQ